MAHLVESIMLVQKPAWHKLGKILDNPPTAEQAIIDSGLNWTVSKRQSFFTDSSGDSIPLPGRFAVVRDMDEAPLGDSGTTWQPLQNKDAFRFFDPFIQSGEATYETAGSLEKGKRIWVLAKIKGDPLEVVKNDAIEKYILLSNYHRAGTSMRGGLTPIRVVCNNTLTGAIMSNKSQIFTATHSNKMDLRLEKIQEEIASADAAFKKAAECYKFFAKKRYTPHMLEEFMSQVFEWTVIDLTKREETHKAKQSEAIHRLIEIGRGADIRGVKGTVWGLYNSVTEYIQHEKGKSEEQRLKNAWFGSGMLTNQRAFNAAMKLSAL